MIRNLKNTEVLNWLDAAADQFRYLFTTIYKSHIHICAKNFSTCRTLTLVLGSFGMMPASGKLRGAEIIKGDVSTCCDISYAIDNVIMFVKTA